MKSALLASLLLTLSGCGLIAKTYVPDEIIVDDYGQISYFNEEGQIKLSVQDIKTLNADDELRHAFIAQAISSSDKKCNEHKATIISNSNSWNVGMGSLSMLLSGSAAVINHAQTAAELAAAATAASGIQSLANEEIYANAMGTTIVRAIEVGRSKKLASINTSLLNDAKQKYTVNSALVDIQQYHAKCSLMAGLVEVTKALDQRKLSSNEIEYKQQKLQNNITNFINEIKNQNALHSPTAEEIAQQKQQLAELNNALQKLIMSDISAPNN